MRQETFQHLEPQTRPAAASTSPQPRGRLAAFFAGRGVSIAAIVGLAAGILLTAAVWLCFQGMQVRRQQTPAHVLWTQLFEQDRNTLIVPADSGLGILQNLTQHSVGVEEYANGAYLSDLHAPPGLDAGNFNDLSRQRYTSVVDLDIVAKLAQLPEFIPDRTQIRYARSITADDIKNSNVILLGSKHTNPWVSLMEKRLNFKLEYEPEVDVSYVLNEHPLKGEQKIYRNGTEATSNHTYGVAAYLPSPDGNGHVLILQGLNMAATQAAADTLFNRAIIAPFLKQAVSSHGKLAAFELLVETTSIGASAPESQVIGERIYPN